MRAYIIIILGLLLLTVIGCTPEQQAQAREMIKENRCAAFNGYVCSAPDDCAVPYLEVIESYCCPIKCGTCNESCDDENQCTRDYCSKATNYTCKHEELSVCPNNGICEKGEYNGIFTSCGGVIGIDDGAEESEDCPKTCDDINDNTEDWYNFEAQECKHKECSTPEETPEEVSSSEEEDSDVIDIGFKFHINQTESTRNITDTWTVTAIDAD